MQVFLFCFDSLRISRVIFIETPKCNNYHRTLQPAALCCQIPHFPVQQKRVNLPIYNYYPIMFQPQNIFRIITLPLSLSHDTNLPHEKPLLFRTACNFRNTVHEKSKKEQERTNGQKEKERERERSNEVFENNFKRKYYSVCSQMIKIKNQWKKEKENKEGDISIAGSKFYERMGSTLLKGLEQPNKDKPTAKWSLKPRQSHKAKASLKLTIQQPSPHHQKYPTFKRQNHSHKELLLQKQLTMKKRQCSGKRSKKIHSNCSIQSKNSNEVTDLKGWNHLQEIIQDDLYEH